MIPDFFQWSVSRPLLALIVVFPTMFVEVCISVLQLALSPYRTGAAAHHRHMRNIQAGR
jgi:hypothetical protein